MRDTADGRGTATHSFRVAAGYSAVLAVDVPGTLPDVLLALDPVSDALRYRQALGVVHLSGTRGRIT